MWGCCSGQDLSRCTSVRAEMPASLRLMNCVLWRGGGQTPASLRLMNCVEGGRREVEGADGGKGGRMRRAGDGGQPRHGPGEEGRATHLDNTILSPASSSRREKWIRPPPPLPSPAA